MNISLNYRFLISLAVRLIIVTGIVSFILVQLLWEQNTLVPLWGQQSVSTDLTVYSAVLAFILTWVVTKSTRRALRQSKVLPLHWHLKSQTLIDRLPSLTLNRAFILSLNGVITSYILILLLHIREMELIPQDQYCVLFVIYVVLFTLAITVMAFYRALGDNFMHKSRI